VLPQDAHALALLGTLPGEVTDGSTASDASDSTRAAIIRIESAPLTSDVVSRRFPGDLLAHVKQLEQNDIVSHPTLYLSNPFCDNVRIKEMILKLPT
jgi:hypothetical protein